MPKQFLSISRVVLGLFFFSTYLSHSQVVRPIAEKDLDSLISNRHGKILVLNLWATWCIPCKEEFPDLVRLSNDMKKKNVEIVAISVDDPDDVSSHIVPFLKKLNVPFRVFVSNFSSQDSLIGKINKDWNGGIPATCIYDKSGKQRMFLFGIQRYEQFKKAVEDVLSKP